MFIDLPTINIEARKDEELKDLILQTLPAYNIHILATQELVRRNNENKNPLHISNGFEAPATITIANGRKLSEQELANIDEDHFDIILDMTANSLKFRENPTLHSHFITAELKGIGPRRIEILKYLLENPSRYISIENVSRLSNQTGIVEPNALAKTISLLRKTLKQKNPKGFYIITKSSMGNVHHIYKMNPDWQYLVVKSNNKSH